MTALLETATVVTAFDAFNLKPKTSSNNAVLFCNAQIWQTDSWWS